jgi:MFS family permease
MSDLVLSGRFLAIAATNFCLFLVVSTWSFLPVFIVEVGGDKVDVGLVMGSLGITSLGSLPFLAPLMDRFRRNIFIVGGILLIGITNASFLLFEHYSPLMIAVRLVQGLAFAACFNGCATAVVDLVPPEHRAQGIGLFGISGSLAIAVGPYLGEAFLLSWGFRAYFILLIGFGLLGGLVGLTIGEPPRKLTSRRSRGFFPTAFNDGYLSMMTLAAIFGSGFAAMNTFFPLHAKTLGLKAGIFFVCYGCSLVSVRIFFGQLTDRIDRSKLIFACLLGFGALLVYTSRIDTLLQTVFLGATFGLVQGLSYPAMMARMVDRSHDGNRAVVVTLFTGSFGVGINVSALAWGFLANLEGLSFMFLVGGLMMFTVAAAWVVGSLVGTQPLEKSVVVENSREPRA